MLTDEHRRRIGKVLGNGEDAEQFAQDILAHIQTLPESDRRPYMEKALRDLEAGSDDYLHDAI